MNCPDCKIEMSEEDASFILTKHGEKVFYCKKCIKSHVTHVMSESEMMLFNRQLRSFGYLRY